MHGSATQNAHSDASATAEQLAYSVPRAAELLDMKPRKVWELVHSGEIESVKIGASRRVPRQALIDYIDRLGRAA